MFAKAKALFKGGKGAGAEADRYSEDFSHAPGAPASTDEDGRAEGYGHGGAKLNRTGSSKAHGGTSSHLSHSYDGGQSPLTSPHAQQEPRGATLTSKSTSSDIKVHGSPKGMYEQFTGNVAQSISHGSDLESSGTYKGGNNGSATDHSRTGKQSPLNPSSAPSLAAIRTNPSVSALPASTPSRPYEPMDASSVGGSSAAPPGASRSSMGPGLTSFPVLKSDPGLRRLGERMTAIHKDFDAKMKKQSLDIIKLEHPRMKERINELQSEIKRLKAKEVEHASSRSSTTTLRQMEDVTQRMKSIQDQIDEIKRRMYFGDTKYTFGSDGVYYAASDISVELIAGQIVLDGGAYMSDTSKGVSAPSEAQQRGRTASTSAGTAAAKRLSGTFAPTLGGSTAIGDTPLQAQVHIQLIGKPPEDRGKSSGSNVNGGDSDTNGSGPSKRSSFVASASDLLSHLSSDPASASPSLSSTPNTSSHGVTIKLRLDGFCFKSENSSLPSLHLEELDLVLIVKIEAQLVYTSGDCTLSQHDTAGRRSSFSSRPMHGQGSHPEQQTSGERGRSASDANLNTSAASSRTRRAAASGVSDDDVVKKGRWAYANFLIDIIDFKGPFAIGRSVLAAIVNLITPKLKAAILSSFPIEIGDMLINSPAFDFGAACWGTARGYFSLHGTRLHFLSQELKKSAELAKALGMMPEHLCMFRSMQKSVGVPVSLKTIADVARYMRKFSGDQALWEELRGLWIEAMNIYVEKVTMIHYESVKGIPAYPIVDRILKLTEDVERKPLKLELRLSYIDGQISLKRLLEASVSWLFRKANRDAAQWVNAGLMKDAALDVETVIANEKKTLYKEHIERAAILSLLKIYITSCGADIGFRLHSGGEINIGIKRGEATLPVTYLASSPLNPFSSGFSDVGGYMLGVFQPTETEELSVTTPEQGVADIKIKSTKVRARTATVDSSNSSGTDQAMHFHPSPATRALRRPSVADQLVDLHASSAAGTNGSGGGVIESVIFHGVFARGSIGMVISPEWAGSDAATSFAPGNQLFSIVLGDTSNTTLTSAPSDRMTSYKLITGCSTRPIIRTLVRALPELETQLSVSRGVSCVATMLGGWPVIVSANNSVRIGAQLGLATISLNLLPFFRFVDAYLSNTEDMKQKLSVDDAAISGIKTFVDTIAKYLALDGLHLDVSLKFKMEVFHYFANSHEDRALDTSDEESRSTDMVLFLNTPTSFRPVGKAPHSGASSASAIIDCEEVGDALNIRVNLCLFDLIDDILSLVNIVVPKAPTGATSGPSTK